MNTIQIIKKSWSLLWRYRALWLFGFLLAMTTANTLWFGYGLDRDEFVTDNRIIFSRYTTWYFPGEGVTIDLRTPGKPLIRVDELDSRFWNDLVDDINMQSVWSVLITCAVIFLVLSILAVLLRYTSRAALIRMVDESEKSGRMASVGRGLRLGWSRVAGRLFLIDLTIGLLVFLVFAVLFFACISPAFFMGFGGIAAILGGSFLIIFLLALFGALGVATAILLSMCRPMMHRACAQDNLGVWASILRGIRLLRMQFAKVAVIWLTNLGVRLGWTIAAIPASILLLPVMLLALPVGIVIGALPGLLAAGISGIFLDTIAAWIIGALVGLPIFLLVFLSPLIFLGGWVQVFVSNMWTLTYRELLSVEVKSLAPQQSQPITAPGAAA